MLIDVPNNEIRAARPATLPISCCPVLDGNDCRLVVLQDGSVRECTGLADGMRLMDEWEQLEQINERRSVERSLCRWSWPSRQQQPAMQV